MNAYERGVADCASCTKACHLFVGWGYRGGAGGPKFCRKFVSFHATSQFYCKNANCTGGTVVSNSPYTYDEKACDNTCDLLCADCDPNALQEAANTVNCELVDDELPQSKCGSSPKFVGGFRVVFGESSAQARQKGVAPSTFAFASPRVCEGDAKAKAEGASRSVGTDETGTTIERGGRGRRTVADGERGILRPTR